MNILHDRKTGNCPPWCIADESCDANRPRGTHVGPYEVLPPGTTPGETSYVVEVTGITEPLVSIQDWRRHVRMPAAEIECSVEDARQLRDALDRVLADIDESGASNDAPA